MPYLIHLGKGNAVYWRFLKSVYPPEPGTISLIAAALIGMGALRCRNSLPIRKSGLR